MVSTADMLWGKRYVVGDYVQPNRAPNKQQGGPQEHPNKQWNLQKKCKSPPELSHEYYVLMWLCCCHPRSGKLNAASATQAQRFYTYRNPCEAIYTDMRRLTRIGVCVCVCHAMDVQGADEPGCKCLFDIIMEYTLDILNCCRRRQRKCIGRRGCCTSLCGGRRRGDSLIKNWLPSCRMKQPELVLAMFGRALLTYSTKQPTQ